MAYKREIIPGPNQDELFSLSDIDPSLPSNNPTEGISVRISDRAKHLQGALRLLGEKHKLIGFLEATGPAMDNPSAGKINLRYGSAGTQRMRLSASDKLAVLDNESKWQFAYATGWMALRGSGILPDEDIITMTRQDFSDFDNTYFGGSEQDKNRAKIRRTLKKQKN